MQRDSESQNMKETPRRFITCGSPLARHESRTKAAVENTRDLEDLCPGRSLFLYVFFHREGSQVRPDPRSSLALRRGGIFQLVKFFIFPQRNKSEWALTRRRGAPICHLPLPRSAFLR